MKKLLIAVFAVGALAAPTMAQATTVHHCMRPTAFVQDLAATNASCAKARVVYAAWNRWDTLAHTEKPWLLTEHGFRFQRQWWRVAAWPVGGEHALTEFISQTAKVTYDR